MKNFLALLLVAFLLSSCITWNVNPQPFPIYTPPPTRTPGVVTATPIIIFATSTPLSSTLTPSLTTVSSLPPTNTDTSTPAVETPTFTPIVVVTNTTIPNPQVSVDILGCDTGFDITHGMGEVTNAFVTIKNTGNVDLQNTCTLLRANDEGREHPDKTRCVDNLPVSNQVTQKLTVDSTYQKDTIIQIDVSSSGNLLLRVDKQSCRDINLFGGAPADVGVVKPIGQ